MNILQILPELNCGGVETGVVDFVKYLKKNNHKAVVVSAGGSLVTQIEAQGAKHYCLKVDKKSIFTAVNCIRELSKIIQDEDIEIVHCRSRVPSWIGYFAARITNTVFITTCHGYYSNHILSWVMGWGKFVIVPSQIIGRRMIDDFGVPLNRIRHIPRGLDTEKFNFVAPENKSRTEFVVAIVGRITPLKGHVCFFKAIQKVTRSIPNIRVWVIGSVPKSKMRYKDDLDVLIKRLGISKYVEFLGARQDINGLLSGVNALVLSSVQHEAFGRVIIEAQAAGVPVVATKVGGVVDIIDDGVNGILVAPGNPDSMAGGIIKVLKDIELSSLLAKNAYVKVRSKFTLERMAENTLKVYQEALASKRVLVIKLSALGDLILSVPALRALRKKYPKPSRIICLVGKDVAPILVNCPYIDELLVYDFKAKDKGFLALLRVAKNIRVKNIDLSIDLQNNRRSHILSALSFAPRRYGYRNGKFSFLLNRKVQEDKFILGPVEHQFRILKMLDIELKDKLIELWPSKEEDDFVKKFFDSQWLAQGQALVGIHIGSSKRWLTKCWPLESIASLSESLATKDIRVVITGNNVHKEELNALLKLVKKSRPIIACDKTTINQLVCLIKRCNAFITADTAPLHIAAGVSVPIVALFGPTDPKRHLPYAENITVIYKGLPCQPCYKPKCATIECMKNISVEEVEKEVLKIISNQKDNG